jgi:excisionase family DNA binding protein
MTGEEDSAITPPGVAVERHLDPDATEDPDPQPAPEAREATWEPPAVLTVDELAALLRVNRKTVYEALGRGEIPGARRIRGRYRILRDAVLRWLADGQGRAPRSRGSR